MRAFKTFQLIIGIIAAILAFGTAYGQSDAERGAREEKQYRSEKKDLNKSITGKDYASKVKRIDMPAAKKEPKSNRHERNAGYKNEWRLSKETKVKSDRRAKAVELPIASTERKQKWLHEMRNIQEDANHNTDK